MAARSVLLLLVTFASMFLALPAHAQDNIFKDGWTLQPDASSLRFQSVKNLTKVELSGFAKFEGKIDKTGEATLRIFLDSVDTKVDLRNVRMRFLFFETFQFPEAVITTRIDQSKLTDLPERRRKIIPLSFNMNLHGISKTYDAEVAVTLMNDDLVAVSTTAPISVAASDFNLDGGIQKLEEAANVAIVPSATVTFDLLFSQNKGVQTEQTRTSSTSQTVAPAALEPEGNFDLDACKGRFEILSRTDNIYFASGRANLDDRSAPLLDSLVDIISRCPDLVIEVAGHTDSVGSAASNTRLSERRAAAVAQYLIARQIPENRIKSVGYGETRPVAANTTTDGRRRNRRIEFVIVE